MNGGGEPLFRRKHRGPRPVVLFKVKIVNFSHNQRPSEADYRVRAEARKKPGCAGVAGITFTPRSLSRSTGFTLLEIILAIVILGVVVSILGEVGRGALRSARLARDTTQAELICESLMGMLRIGLIDLEDQTDVPLQNDYPDTNAMSVARGEVLWNYSVEIYSVEESGMLEVAITVRQNKPEQDRPVACRMVRWMIDPEYLEDMELEMEEILNPETTTDSSSSSSNSST